MSDLKALTEQYINAFNSKDAVAVAALLHENTALEDPVVKRLEGKDAVMSAIGGMFNDNAQLLFRAKNIFQDGQTTFIEFILQLGDLTLEGVDIIVWEGDLIKELRAYLDIPKG